MSEPTKFEIADYIVALEQKVEAAEARVVALEEALGDLINWAVAADSQIHGEWGIGSYVEDDLIAEARAVLDTGKRETSDKDVHHDGRGTASTQ